MGFDDASKKLQDDTCSDARKRVIPLRRLTTQLFRDLDFGVELAANMQPHELPEELGFDFILSCSLMQASSVDKNNLCKKTKNLRIVE